jgi:hypothetical protein
VAINKNVTRLSTFAWCDTFQGALKSGALQDKQRPGHLSMSAALCINCEFTSSCVQKRGKELLRSRAAFFSFYIQAHIIHRDGPSKYFAISSRVAPARVGLSELARRPHTHELLLSGRRENLSTPTLRMEHLVTSEEAQSERKHLPTELIMTISP